MPKRLLPVKLTDSDRLVISRDQSAAISDEVRAIEAKKAATQGHNAEIKRIRAKILELNQALVTGAIDREVDVEERPVYDRKVVEVWRLDTKELVESRAMDDDERQLSLKAVDQTLKQAIAADGKPIEPLTEEQIIAASPEEAEELRAHRLAAEKKERERQEAAEVWLNGLQSRIMVFPAEEDIDGCTAKIGAVDGFGWTILSADGQTEVEARKNLGDQLIAQFVGAAEQRERERQERILRALGELMPKFVVTMVEGGGAVAKVEADTWVTEAEGESAEDATKALRAKVIGILERREDEIAQLAADQQADAGGKKPRALLKAPAGKKGKKAAPKSDEPKTDEPPAQPKDGEDGEDGEGLAF